MKDCLMLQNLSKKNLINPVNAHRTNTELASLKVRGKIVQKRILVSESKLFSLKQVFVLATQVFEDHF